MEALATGSDWRRYFRAWTADSLDGTWTPLADTEANAFIRSGNVTFAAGQSALATRGWTRPRAATIPDFPGGWAC